MLNKEVFCAPFQENFVEILINFSVENNRIISIDFWIFLRFWFSKFGKKCWSLNGWNRDIYFSKLHPPSDQGEMIFNNSRKFKVLLFCLIIFTQKLIYFTQFSENFWRFFLKQTYYITCGEKYIQKAGGVIFF